MGQNQINIALLGLGRIGQMHALNLTYHPEFNLKSVSYTHLTLPTNREV